MVFKDKTSNVSRIHWSHWRCEHLWILYLDVFGLYKWPCQKKQAEMLKEYVSRAWKLGSGDVWDVRRTGNQLLDSQWLINMSLVCPEIRCPLKRQVE